MAPKSRSSPASNNQTGRFKVFELGVVRALAVKLGTDFQFVEITSLFSLLVERSMMVILGERFDCVLDFPKTFPINRFPLKGAYIAWSKKFYWFIGQSSLRQNHWYPGIGLTRPRLSARHDLKVEKVAFRKSKL